MGEIRVLDRLVADMIAAGEVVERPQSAAKELIENAVDAGATQITIEIKNGGSLFLRVSDNGKGIRKEDVPLAFQSHATSKIRTQEDLAGILTLGFRGEALASIAAVSKVEVITKHREETVGTNYKIEGGAVVSNEDIGCPDGTTVVMRHLFYNVPARQKFLKKDQTEAAYISEIVGKFILAYPSVCFRYINNGKEEMFSSGSGKPLDCCATVFGRDIALALLPVLREENGISVEGFIGPNSVTRGNRGYECFFLNGRYVKSRMLSVAVETAFGQKLQKGRFPVCDLHITVSPLAVDVNVHPQKMEVKFSNEKLLFDAIYWAVTQALKESTSSFQVTQAPKNDFSSHTYGSAPAGQYFTLNPLDGRKAEQETMRPVLSAQGLDSSQPPVKARPTQEQNESGQPADSFVFRENSAEYAAEPMKQETDASSVHPQNELGTIDPVGNAMSKMQSVSRTEQTETRTDTQPKNLSGVSSELFRGIRMVGQVFDTYIIVENGDEMLLIDQHAAHERINYERMLQDFNEGGVYPQLYLEPVPVELSETERDLLFSNQPFFEKAGFEIEEFGPRSVLVRQAPFAAVASTVREMIFDILEALKDHREEALIDVQRRALYTVACKASVKGNQKLSQPELLTLCKQALELDRLETCPHGRPIVLSFPKYFIEKQFKRK